MDDLRASDSHTATPTWSPAAETASSAGGDAVGVAALARVGGALGGDAICAFDLLAAPPLATAGVSVA